MSEELPTQERCCHMDDKGGGRCHEQATQFVKRPYLADPFRNTLWFCDQHVAEHTSANDKVSPFVGKYEPGKV